MKKFFPCLILFAFSQVVLAQTKVYEYARIISDDEHARLYNFAEQLKKDEANKGILIVYKDKSEPTGKFVRYFYGVKNVLVEDFDVSPERFSILFGGENTRRTEIWLRKLKEETSKFEDKVLDETLAGKINQKTLFDQACIDCDNSPFIDQFIFREGIDYLAESLKANPQTKAVIEIAKVEYLSKTAKDRRDLITQIFDRLEKKQIQRNKVSVRFTSGMFAKIYIIPIRKKNKT